MFRLHQCYNGLASKADLGLDIDILNFPARPGPYVHGTITKAGVAGEGFSS